MLSKAKIFTWLYINMYLPHMLPINKHGCAYIDMRKYDALIVGFLILKKSALLIFKERNNLKECLM